MSRIEKIKTNKLVYKRTEIEEAPKPKRGLAWFTVILIIPLIFYLVFFSPVFKVKEFEVNGYSNPDIVRQIAGEQASKNLISGNILFFSKTKLADTLRGDQKVTEVKINKNYPNKITINISESKPSLIWNTAGDYFLIDERGVVIGPAFNEKLPVLYDAANISVRAGEEVASPTFVKFIRDISEGFKGATGVSITKITIFDLMSDVHITSSAGWTVYLNSSKSAEAQLKNLSRVLAESRKSKTKLEYIDIRLDNRIFYK